MQKHSSDYADEYLAKIFVGRKIKDTYNRGDPNVEK